MDKYEFNIKVEQLKKLINKGDYDTAMKIADTIDWRRVRNANLLSQVSQVYEKNHEYHEAKEILLIAFERAPIGKRLLYKLTQLALKDGEIQEAEAYYREFCSLAEDDSRQYILRYLILKAKNASSEQLISVLESYTSLELDEKWLYELAEQYSLAGMERECIATCDKIMLMFGLGKYVEKAMDLKVQYAPLTNYQRDLVENRDVYEGRLKAVEQGNYYAEEPGFDNQVYGQPQAYRENGTYSPATAYEEENVYNQPGTYEREEIYGQGEGAYEINESYGQDGFYEGDGSYGQEAYYGNESGYGQDPVYEEGAYDQAGSYGQDGFYEDEYYQGQNYGGPQAYDQEPQYYGQDDYQQEQAYAETAAAVEPEGYPYYQTPPVYRNDVPAMPAKQIQPEEELQAQMKEAEAEEELAQEMSRLSGDKYSQLTSENPNVSYTRVLNNVKDLKQGSQEVEKTRVIRNIQEARAAYQNEIAAPVRSRVERLTQPNHLMIEAESAEEGIELAKNALKKIHQELGTKNPAAKITGTKLNARGLFAVADKLAGKDLIIEGAADMSSVLLDELNRLMAYDETGIVVVLIDTPERLEALHNQNPALASYFECIGSKRNPQKAELEAPRQEEDTRPVRMVTPIREEKGTYRKESYKEENSYKEEGYEEEDSYEEEGYEEEGAYGEEGYEEEGAYEEEGYEEEGAYEEEGYEEGGSYEEDESYEEEVPEEEMTIDESAQYASQYASQIDCSITGKSMLALYERIEIMEENNIPLTRENAENLIEEAADKAEKRSLGKMITGVFSSRYDKDGLLILKEEHFI